MPPSVRQTNFSAGELAPLYWGRTDLGIHPKGLRRCRNFAVLKSGAAMSRPGTTFVAETAGGNVTEHPPRLIPFVYSDEQAYLCEFGDDLAGDGGYIRIYRLGNLVANITGTRIPAADLPKLKFAQTGNILTVCIPNIVFLTPMELRRVDDVTWTWTATQFAPPAALLPDVGSSAMANPFNPGAVPTLKGTTPFSLKLPLPTTDTSHPAREWIYAFTSILQRLSDGAVLESVATVVKYSTDGVEDLVHFTPVQTLLTDHQVVCYSDKAVTLVRLAKDEDLGSDYRALSFRIYKGAGDLLGWIGDTRTRDFVDNGIDPDYSVQPPIGSNPFTFRAHPSGLQPTRTPLSVGFFQERRCFGGALGDDITVPSQPGHLFCSSIGDYYNFDERLAIHVSGEALVFELAARRREWIRHLVGLERLVVLTNSSVWTIGGQTGSPLDFDSVDARQNDDVGASEVRPVVVDGCVLFIRTKGSGARALVPQASDTPYQGVDVSDHAQHLVVGKDRAIIDWCYAEDPFGIVWAVRADGTLLSLTFGRSQAAWARHDTDGTYEAVCSIPEGEEDAVYVVVKRTIAGVVKRYIERMTSRVRRVLESDDPPEYVSDPTVADTDTLYPTDVCVDCAFVYSGPVTATITDADLAKLNGKSVYVVARGSPVLGPYPVTLDELGSGVVEIDFPEAPTANAVDENDVPIWVAHVGLLFEPELETLDVAGGEARLRKKTVARVGFEVDNARGLSVGQDLEHLKPWRQRQVADSFDPISASTALVDTPVAATWDHAARAALRQTLPLPVTVVGITRELAFDEG
jgi:hypothetical protein